mgnify:CR=1 FL=1
MQGGWYTRQQCADFLGMKVDNLDKQFRKQLPESAVIKHKQQIAYHAPTLIALVVEKRANEIAEDIGGPMTPAKERYQAAKADLAELDLATRRKEVLPRTAVVECLSLAHGGLRGLIERWERKHRQADAKELRAAIAAGLKALDAVLAKPEVEDAAS